MQVLHNLGSPEAQAVLEVRSPSMKDYILGGVIAALVLSPLWAVTVYYVISR
jgi:hypothetical protein